MSREFQTETEFATLTIGHHVGESLDLTCVGRNGGGAILLDIEQVTGLRDALSRWLDGSIYLGSAPTEPQRREAEQ